MLWFRVLGALAVVDGEDAVSAGGARQRRLLAMLLQNRDCVVSLDRLADGVFVGEPTARATTTVRSYVARLRRVVERPGSGCRIVTEAPGYKLAVAAEAFDADCFEEALATGRSALDRGDAAAAIAAFRAGLELWRGDAYAEFADEAWAAGEAQRLRELRLVAYEGLADAELAAGHPAEAVSLVEGLLADHPLRESFQARLMVALYRSGRHVEALRSYQAHRDVLAAELGLEPAPELAEIEARILAHDDALHEPVAGGAPLRGYQLGERLGSGRDGTVYAAHVRGVERDMVIRAVPAPVADDPGFVRAFDAGIRRLASLHPGVVPVHDWWREPGGAFVVMRRMRGGTLRDRLTDGPLPPEEAAQVIQRVGAALVAAAEVGIEHGRVDAASVLYDDRDVAYLGDFPLGPCDRDGSAGRDGRVADDAGLVALAIEAHTGSRPGTGPLAGTDGEKPPPALAALLAATPAANGPASPEAVARVMGAAVAALTGEAARPAAERTNPYKGLRAFGEPDAADFFGRDRFVQAVVDRLGRPGAAGRLVLVVGGSGSGKTSVVRAGILPRVRRGEVPGAASLYVAEMTPGRDPFEELAEALRRVAVADVEGLPAALAADGGLEAVVDRLVPAGGELLLVVDQLEELFTLAPPADQRAFLDGIARATAAPGSRLRVVATLRADFYDAPLRFERIAARAGDATVPIGPMAAADLEAAVVGPASRAGMSVEPALVAELVGAVAHEPAALPALQFTLTELAERSPDGRLTLSAYRAVGGLDRAIAVRAEELYTSLAPATRRSVRRMFEHLVVVDTDGEPTRRRAVVADLVATAGQPGPDGDGGGHGPDGVDGPGGEGDARAVLEVWAQARLLTLDRLPGSRAPTAEVAHEALLREWPRLRDWVEADREALVTLAQLRDAAAAWEAVDHDPGALYRGVRLDAALDVAGAGRRPVPPAERRFLDASRAERDREHDREAERVQHVTRTNRRLRAQLVAVGVAMAVALAGGTIAVMQRDRAEGQGQVAQARELAAAANANVATDPERSTLLALVAVDLSAGDGSTARPQAEEALHRAVTANRLDRRHPGAGVFDASPDGRTFVATRPEDSSRFADIRSVATGEVRHALPAHVGGVTGAAYSPDGSQLVTGGVDGALAVWDVDAGRKVRTVVGAGEAASWGPAFAPDGTTVAAAWQADGVVRVVDVATGDTVREVRSVAEPVAVAFDPDGGRIAVASASVPQAKVVDLASGDDVVTLDGHLRSLGDVEWSDDGRWVATAGDDGSARVWDATTGTQRHVLLGHEAAVYNVEWAPGSERLATASGDGTAKVWQLTEGGPREMFTLSAHDMSEGVLGLVFSPDGTRLMTGDVEVDATQVWDVSIGGDAEAGNFPGVAFHYGSAALSPDGRHLYATSPGDSVTAWDVAEGRAVRTLGDGPPPDPAAYAPPTTGTPQEVGRVAVAPDGSGVAAVTYADGAFFRRFGDDVVRAWDPASGEELFTVEPGGEVVGADWSPDSRFVALAVADSEAGDRLVVVDRGGEAVEEIAVERPAGVGEVAFTPDGRWLVAPRVPVEQDDDTAGTDLWDWRRGEVVGTIDTPYGDAVVSDAGTHVVATPYDTVTGSADAEVWDVATGRRTARLEGGAGNVAITPDGRIAVTGANDGVVRVWDVEAGTERLALDAHLGAISDVDLAADGTTAVSVGADGTARVWALDLDELVALAEDELTRDLTDDECRRYLHVDRCP